MIRTAKIEDAQALAALNGFVHMLHAEAEPWFFKSVGPAYFAARVQAFGEILADSDQVVFIAEAVSPDADTPKAAGYLWASRRDNDENAEIFACKRLWINHISVHPDYFRQGIGEALMNEAKALAKQRSANLLLNVHSFNTRAQQFFAKQGFAPLSHTMWLEP